MCVNVCVHACLRVILCADMFMYVCACVQGGVQVSVDVKVEDRFLCHA